MPLKKGKSQKTVSANIRSEMHSYEKTGKIGTSKPASKKKAVKQAVAIAYSKARESGATLPKKASSTATKKSSGTTKKRTTAKPGPKKGSRKSTAKKSPRKKASQGRRAAIR